jgi:hypothetical protein
MSDMRVDGSLQKKKEKNNKSARTHPAYRQIWDTLVGESVRDARSRDESKTREQDKREKR